MIDPYAYHCECCKKRMETVRLLSEKDAEIDHIDRARRGFSKQCDDLVKRSLERELVLASLQAQLSAAREALNHIEIYTHKNEGEFHEIVKKAQVSGDIDEITNAPDGIALASLVNRTAKQALTLSPHEALDRVRKEAQIEVLEKVRDSVDAESQIVSQHISDSIIKEKDVYVIIDARISALKSKEVE